MATIYVLGDVGLYDDTVKELVDLIVLNSHSPSDSALVLAGDNFYPDGIQSTQDPRIARVASIFRAWRHPVYAILGNHDYVGNPLAQLSLWKMPNFYYSKKFADGLIECWFIDTMLFDPGNPQDPNIYHNMHGHIARSHGSLNEAAQRQYHWLANGLRKSKAPHKLVFGHYPLLSNGSYADNNELLKILLPLFYQYRVTAYVSGHDHNTQHLKIKVDQNYSLHQFIIGASSHQTVYGQHRESRELKYYNSVPSFLKIFSYNRQLVFQVYDFTGSIVYQYRFRSRTARGRHT